MLAINDSHRHGCTSRMLGQRSKPINNVPQGFEPRWLCAEPSNGDHQCGQLTFNKRITILSMWQTKLNSDHFKCDNPINRASTIWSSVKYGCPLNNVINWQPLMLSTPINCKCNQSDDQCSTPIKCKCENPCNTASTIGSTVNMIVRSTVIVYSSIQYN